MAKKVQAKTAPAETVDEAKLAMINASVLPAGEPPVVDLLGDPLVETAPAGETEQDIHIAELEAEVASLEARIEQLLAEKAKPAPTHARTLDELPSPFAPT